LFSSIITVLIASLGLQTPLFLFLLMSARGQTSQTTYVEVTADTQYRLRIGRDLNVELISDDISRKYRDYSANRPTEYSLSLRESAVTGVLIDLGKHINILTVALSEMKASRMILLNN
jgi:hypothetical protein